MSGIYSADRLYRTLSSDDFLGLQFFFALQLVLQNPVACKLPHVTSKTRICLADYFKSFLQEAEHLLHHLRHGLPGLQVFGRLPNEFGEGARQIPDEPLYNQVVDLQQPVARQSGRSRAMCKIYIVNVGNTPAAQQANLRADPSNLQCKFNSVQSTTRSIINKAPLIHYSEDRLRERRLRTSDCRIQRSPMKHWIWFIKSARMRLSSGGSQTATNGLQNRSNCSAHQAR